MSQQVLKTGLNLVRKRFMDVAANHFPKEMLEHEIMLYRAKMLFDNTVLGGKNNRSLLSLATFEAFRPDADLEVKTVAAEASAVLEMVQAFYLIADDIMDQSDTRRGKPTWHKMPGVGLSAINDAFLIDVCALEILQQLYPAHPQIHKILEAYNRSKRMTVIGQFLDSASQNQLKSFTWERYEQLVQHKTSHYTIFHPIEQALLICDIMKGHVNVRKVAYQIGFLFQAQDDILDVFGEPEVTGKIGTDLNHGKCTFVTTRAIEKLSKKPNSTLSQFEASFGKPDEENLRIIRQIINDLRIKEEWDQLQKNMTQRITQDLQKLPIELQPAADVLGDLLKKLVNRSK